VWICAFPGGGVGVETAAFQKFPYTLSPNGLTACIAGHESGEWARKHTISLYSKPSRLVMLARGIGISGKPAPNGSVSRRIVSLEPLRSFPVLYFWCFLSFFSEKFSFFRNKCLTEHTAGLK